MSPRDKYSKIICYPELKLSLQFTTFTIIKLFYLFWQHMRRIDGLLTVKWHVNFFMLLISVHGRPSAP